MFATQATVTSAQVAVRYRPRVGRYVDRHIGRASVDMSTDMSVGIATDISVEGCTNYT